MALGGPTEELIKRLLAAMSSHKESDSVIAQARAEAEQEVRSLLKSAFKATLLRQAVEQLEGGHAQPAEGARDHEPEPNNAFSTHVADPVTVGCYLYAITSSAPGASPPACAAIDPAFPIELAEYDDIQAVVSNVPLEHFDSVAMKDRVADRQWVETAVRAHDEVVKSAMTFGAVIPCRFCTIVRSRDDIYALLSKHHDRIASTLESLAGKNEWGVKVFYPQPAAQQVAENISGTTYLQQKQQAKERAIKNERAARDRAIRLHDLLSASAASAARLPPRRQSTEGARELLLNGAYLVADRETERFHAAVSDWTERHAPEGLGVEVTGPWPPYNFADLDLSLEAVA
jgi:gas vesicle protein GvpL/GvpF